MRSGLFILVLLAAVFPTVAPADGTVQPKYPPGFDCSAVAAGSPRQACNKSHLDPPMGSIRKDDTRAKPGFTLQPSRPPTVPSGPPPTIPRLPGTIDTGN